MCSCAGRVTLGVDRMALYPTNPRWGIIHLFVVDSKLKMNMRLLENRFYTNANWEKPLRLKSVPSPEMVRLFDQNGYRLTDLEVFYAEANQQLTVAHRNERVLKKEWFLQEKKTTGPIL